MLNQVLLNTAQKVLNKASGGQWIIRTRFTSGKAGGTFSLYPFKVDALTFDRNYADNYGDVITMDLKISPRDYALMFDQGQDLLCTVTMIPTDEHGRMVASKKPIQKQYRALVANPVDLRKIQTDVHVFTQPTMSMQVELVEDIVYTLRHTKINVVFQTCDVKSAIYGITQRLGIGQLHLVDPDNTHVWDHITIGQHQGIDSIYGYLQSTCGIYARGINSYLTDGVLYVYPPFATDPTYDKTAMFYQVDAGRYNAVSSFHYTENQTTSIVLNTKPEVQDLSTTASENIGTGFVFNRASRLRDAITYVDPKTGPAYTQDSALVVSLDSPRIASEGKQNLIHIGATDNPYPQMSEIAAGQANLVKTTWMHADPFVLDPCHKLIYYYDSNNVMVKKTGILEQATYRLQEVTRLGEDFLYGCVGALVLRLSPEGNEIATEKQ